MGLLEAKGDLCIFFPLARLKWATSQARADTGYPEEEATERRAVLPSSSTSTRTQGFSETAGAGVFGGSGPSCVALGASGDTPELRSAVSKEAIREAGVSFPASVLRNEKEPGCSLTFKWFLRCVYHTRNSGSGIKVLAEVEPLSR